MKPYIPSNWRPNEISSGHGDFGDLLSASGAGLPSVILFRLRNMHPDRINLHIREIISHCENDLKKGAIITVAEGGFRIRNLPLGFR